MSDSTTAELKPTVTRVQNEPSEDVAQQVEENHVDQSESTASEEPNLNANVVRVGLKRRRFQEFWRKQYRLIVDRLSFQKRAHVETAEVQEDQSPGAAPLNAPSLTHQSSVSDLDPLEHDKSEVPVTLPDGDHEKPVPAVTDPEDWVDTATSTVHAQPSSAN